MKVESSMANTECVFGVKFDILPNILLIINLIPLKLILNSLLMIVRQGRVGGRTRLIIAGDGCTHNNI